MKRPLHSSHRQRGVALVVSLILLALVSLAALGSMRSVALEARMSASSYDRNLGFQAAETGLREAEGLTVAATAASFPGSGCSAGYCAEPAPADAARWNDEAFVGWVDATSA
ncbi:MAG: PilX N-terminal domain-containing pilus assembly protein, partial [Variovorax sp.]